MSSLARGSRPAAVVAVALPVVLLTWYGCTWEYQSATDADGGVGDGAPPSDALASDGPYKLPDGRVCTGHDEDGDGVPDDCDNCPNVANADQAGGAVGAACTPAPTIVASPTRLLFDPFRSLAASWKSFGSGTAAFSVRSDMDSIIGGDAKSDELPFLVDTGGAGPSIAVTTMVTVTEDSVPAGGDAAAPAAGNAGVLLRVNGDTSKRFYACLVSPRAESFALAWTGSTGACSGAACSLELFASLGDAGIVPFRSVIPKDIPHGLNTPIGIRAIVATTSTDGGLTTTFGCRVFDPKKPSTLEATGAGYSLVTTLSSGKSFATGDVGLFATRVRAVFSSIDVLRGK